MRGRFGARGRSSSSGEAARVRESQQWVFSESPVQRVVNQRGRTSHCTKVASFALLLAACSANDLPTGSSPSGGSTGNGPAYTRPVASIALANVPLTRMPVGSVLPGPAGVQLFDANGRVIGAGAVVQFSIASGAATIDTARAITDALGIASFGSLHMPAQPGFSTLRVRVDGRADTLMTFEAARPSSTIDGDYDLQQAEGRALPAGYMNVAGLLYTDALDTVTSATLTIRGSRYTLTATVRAGLTLSPTRYTDVTTGDVVFNAQANGPSNFSLRPDLLTPFKIATADRNVGFVANDGRLMLRQDMPYAWPIWGVLNDFMKR